MNKKEFLSRMKKYGDTQATLGEALGLPQSAISGRINGTIEFKKSEINLIRKRYELSDSDTILIFFTD